jgi:hypothetical protein
MGQSGTDMAIFAEKIEISATRELHRHTNASEFNYGMAGTAQIGIVALDCSSQTCVAVLPK